MVGPAAAVSPHFLNPVLEFLSDNLPSSLYILLLKVLSHSLATIVALTNLCQSLLSSSDWNVQTLLPPIITLLAAYLALSGLYRTTSWLIRLIFWFMKWGSLLGIFMGGLGYWMGGAAGNAVGNQGPIPFLGGYVADLFSNQASRTRGTRQPKSRSRKTQLKRPTAWESFERHEEYRRQNEVQDENVYRSMKVIVDAAGYVFGRVVKGLPEGTVVDTEKSPSKGGSKAKGRAGSSRSR